MNKSEVTLDLDWGVWCGIQSRGFSILELSRVFVGGLRLGNAEVKVGRAVALASVCLQRNAHTTGNTSEIQGIEHVPY